MSIEEILSLAPVVPVVEIADPSTAVPLARALVAGGLSVIEVTLRTPAAEEAIRSIVAEVPGMTVGVGTVRSALDVQRALDTGASFIVTPGTPPWLAVTLTECPLPSLPGAATVSEVMALRDNGFRAVKLFPAAVVGGAAWIRALAGPIPDVLVCPTGGITLETAADYLALASVPCVGGTWVAPASRIASHDWDGIEVAARAAAALRDTSS